MRSLYALTNRYHASGTGLLDKHRLQASKEGKVAQLKEVAFGGKYQDRVHERARPTRSISTPTLLSHQARSDSVKAHSKYTEKVLEHMNAPLDRKKIRRRSSLVSFLAAKSPQPHAQLPLLGGGGEGVDEGSRSGALPQPHQQAQTKVPSFGL